MKINKLFLLALIVFGVFQFKASAQHEAKTNVLGLFVGSFGLQYEYVTEEMGFLLGMNYFTSGALVNTDNDYRSFSITPEFRYYFNPDEDASGYFAGAYLRYRSATGEDWYTYSDGTNTVTSDMKNTGLAIGILTGYKWVTRSGLVFETFGGLGRYLINNYSYDPEIPDVDTFTTGLNELPAFDFRFGIGVGYRFGG